MDTQDLVTYINKNQIQKDLITFIRGDIHWSELENLGLKISFPNHLLNIDRLESLEKITVTPTIEDIIEGIFTYKDHPRDLKEWAAIVHGLPLIDFEKIEKDKNGNNITEILWDLSFGVPLSENIVSFINEFKRNN